MVCDPYARWCERGAPRGVPLLDFLLAPGKVVDADLRRHDGCGAVRRACRPSSARREWRSLSWTPAFVGTTSMAQAVMDAGRRRHDERGAGCHARRSSPAGREGRRLSGSDDGGAARVNEDSACGSGFTSRCVTTWVRFAAQAREAAEVLANKNRRGIAAAAVAWHNQDRFSAAGRSPRRARSPARCSSPSAGSACCRCVARSHARPSPTSAQSRKAA